MEQTSFFETEFEPQKKKVWTVSQLNRAVRGRLESDYSGIWVEGEISNFKHHTSGHIYFTLKDEQSQIGAVFFSRLNQLVKFELKDGLKVLAVGKLSLYEARGQYQLYVERLEPKGVGALELAFLQLKEKLEKEGLFDHARKKPIPRFPKTVGIVTSPTGAAIRDILNVISRRFDGTNILLHPVRVQGEGSAEEIARAIDEMNAFGEIDVLIVGRGGGSLEDLWAFNEEAVARAVFRSRIPIISAVGHEIDWTICDLVADLRAPTPSAAAELVVESRQELEARLRDLADRLRNGALVFIGEKRTELERLQESYAFKYPAQLMDQFSQKLDELLRQLGNYAKTLVAHKRHAFRHLTGKLEALSPIGILNRGYSLTFAKTGVLIKEIRQVKTGDDLMTRLERGRIHSKVTSVETGREEDHE